MKYKWKVGDRVIYDNHRRVGSLNVFNVEALRNGYAYTKEWVYATKLAMRVLCAHLTDMTRYY
jgi:hypothetical protein